MWWNETDRSLQQMTRQCIAVYIKSSVWCLCGVQADLPQGMITSACFRLGATKVSNAGLTNFVYCSMTPAMSLPRSATSLCILQVTALLNCYHAQQHPCKDAVQGLVELTGSACRTSLYSYTCSGLSAAVMRHMWPTSWPAGGHRLCPQRSSCSAAPGCSRCAAPGCPL